MSCRELAVGKGGKGAVVIRPKTARCGVSRPYILQREEWGILLCSVLDGVAQRAPRTGGRVAGSSGVGVALYSA